MKSPSCDYYTPLKNLYYDKKYLESFISESLDEEDWYVFDCGKIRWTVRENYQSNRTECTSFKRSDFFLEMHEIFTIPINIGDVLFTRTPPPGIPPHIDRNRPAAINLPVSGKLFNSHMVWYDSFDKGSIVHQYNHIQEDNGLQKTMGVLFDPKKIHGVINEDDPDRCLLTIWWRNHSYKTLLDLWRKNEFFNMDALRGCKHWKFILEE